MKKILGAIVIIVLFITGLFLFFQNQNLKQEIDVLNQKIEELQKVKPEPVTEKIPGGWKEYVDEEYKFKIWYPNNNDATIVYKYVNYKNINTIDFSIPNPSDMSLGLLRIYIYKENISNVTDFIPEEIKDEIKNINNIEKYISQTKINSIDAYKLDIPDGFIRYYIKRNNKIIVLASDYLESASYHGLKSTFDQMVHSFKFIE